MAEATWIKTYIGTQAQRFSPRIATRAFSTVWVTFGGGNGVPMKNSNVNPGLINPVYGCFVGRVPFKYQITTIGGVPRLINIPLFSKIRG
jgi:hypothetical protein